MPLEECNMVVRNIVENAVKYSFSAKVPQVWFEAEVSAEGLILAISNNGLAVDEELRDEIFKEGVRSDIADSRFPAGMGLGLAHCVRLMGEGQNRYGTVRLGSPKRTAGQKTTIEVVFSAITTGRVVGEVR
jgi:signal transduction histidine kinase